MSHSHHYYNHSVTMKDIKVSKAARLQRATVRKRRRTLLKKAHDFHKLCSAEVFLVIYKNSKFYVYSSNDKNTMWPPPLSDIVSIDFPPSSSTSSDISQQLTYPLPELYRPSRVGDLEQIDNGQAIGET
jgi:hypothetical protein